MLNMLWVSDCLPEPVFVGIAFPLCLGGLGYDTQPSQTKDLKLVVEATLTNAWHIKAKTGWLIDRIMWPGGISYECACGVISQWDSTIKGLSFPLKDC